MSRVNIKKILTFSTILLLIGVNIIPNITGIKSKKDEFINSDEKYSPIYESGNTLIAEGDEYRVIEVDDGGNIVWQKSGLNFPVDAERLDNGNTLITDQYDHHIIEVNSGGSIVWEYSSGLNSLYDAERLNNGNTLIVDATDGRVIEVNSGGGIVWQKTGLNIPLDAERLDNGNTLIVDGWNHRVIEVNNAGSIVWQKSIDYPCDVERLGNGNTLITAESCIIEVNNGGSIVWEYSGIGPSDAERLNNGNTLIADTSGGRVIEVNSNGDIVWQKTGLQAVTDAERIVEASDIIVKEIRGGFRVNIELKNIGNETAYDVPWSIDLDGGIILVGDHSEGTINALNPGQGKTVRQTSLFGIGHNVMITVTAGDFSKQAIANWILGPLVLGVSDNN